MADQPNVNPTPKQEFQANKGYVTLHREMMQQPMMGVSIHYALLQYQRQMCPPGAKDPEGAGTCAANFYKLQGAQDIIDILLKLAEMPTPQPTTKRPDQIKHNV